MQFPKIPANHWYMAFLWCHSTGVVHSLKLRVHKHWQRHVSIAHDVTQLYSFPMEDGASQGHNACTKVPVESLDGQEMHTRPSSQLGTSEKISHEALKRSLSYYEELRMWGIPEMGDIAKATYRHLLDISQERAMCAPYVRPKDELRPLTSTTWLKGLTWSCRFVCPAGLWSWLSPVFPCCDSFSLGDGSV